jgi:hypothetical protein
MYFIYLFIILVLEIEPRTHTIFLLYICQTHFIFALSLMLHRNALCGKLQCENVQGMPVFGIVPAIIQSPSRGTTCWGVDFQLGSDVPDPGMVNEGTKCGAGKVI